MAVDHLNTNVGFGTQSKILQRMGDRKRKKILNDFHRKNYDKQEKEISSENFNKKTNKYKARLKTIENI